MQRRIKVEFNEVRRRFNFKVSVGSFGSFSLSGLVFC
jgi:hypothetical protein